MYRSTYKIFSPTQKCNTFMTSSFDQMLSQAHLWLWRCGGFVFRLNLPVWRPASVLTCLPASLSMANRLYVYLSACLLSCLTMCLSGFLTILLRSYGTVCMPVPVNASIELSASFWLPSCHPGQPVVYLHAVPSSGTCLLPASLPACQSACPPLF